MSQTRSGRALNGFLEAHRLTHRLVSALLVEQGLRPSVIGSLVTLSPGTAAGHVSATSPFHQAARARALLQE